MSVSIKIGLGLDGKLMMPHPAQAGLIVGGPSKVLAWLEAQLGLAVPDTGFTKRMLQYLACLKEVDSTSRFYHESLLVDPLGVARQILQWRDHLYLAAWDGGQLPHVSPRLTDIEAVEKLARDRVAFNEGQRVFRVIEALEVISLDIELEVCDPVTSFPAVWQRLLNYLEPHYQPFYAEIPAKSDSDLGRLQTALRSETSDAVQLEGDGSLILIRAPSRACSAEWLAHAIAEKLTAQSGQSIGLLCDGPADAVDLALKQVGVPQLAVGQASALRPVFQVLSLALELLWEPLNPQYLLAFLAHPVGPLPVRLRRPLAELVANEPGIGGEVWDACIEKMIESEIAKCDISEKVAGVEGKIRDQLAFWLMNERYSNSEGAPLEIVKERVRAISTWMGGYRQVLSQKSESEAEIELIGQAQSHLWECLEALDQLEQQNLSHIGANDLRRLINEVRGDGFTRPDVWPELSANLPTIDYAKDPACCISNQDLLVWWGMDAPHQPQHTGWNRSERAELCASGVEIDDVGETISWHANSWLRPLFAARSLLCLVIHDDAESKHPVLDLIKSRVRCIPEYDLQTLIQSTDEMENFPLAVTLRDQTALCLPSRTRIWQLPEGQLIPRRERESFSSLESFLLGPYQWVLRYPARLKTGALLEISDDNRLKGNLAHALFEAFFSRPEHAALHSLLLSDVREWSRSALNDLIATRGTVLLLPGRMAERERFIEDSTEALVALVQHLQAGDVVSVQLESEQDGTFTGGKLAGVLDMITTRRDGREAVIDLKWAGAKYRRESLREGTCLQLAIYAQLRLQDSGRMPDVGYFVISSRELLMFDSDYFPQAESIRPENNEGLLQIWQRLETTWKQRRQQLDRGMIEVNVSGTEPLGAFQLDENALTVPDTFESFNEFVALVGWEAEA
ncbi:hypothetical protein A8C75_08970 [Marinobacterium aestuarii]|uniref:PD-(D/E)XK endonuclease-like domain-containing protein n=1 Tax=Marinobacterium aestuarii TaxID=1821621 RepID=A0A1A9EY95_9GAMM|nr:PD-(D/E)XK nuclease family protein [Marinobacterium aestuarii]ANG62601.1 hypothetical protein A8C75_08970 [Marinobacterium aestuarii]